MEPTVIETKCHETLSPVLEKLIELVRHNPSVHDTSRLDYRDKIKHANIWESIAAVLGREKTGK